MNKHKEGDNVLIEVEIKRISDHGELSFVQTKGYTTTFNNLVTKTKITSKHDNSFYVLTKELIPANENALLVKQYEELLDRYDVAAKALELLTEDPINYSNTKDVAQRALKKINQMIKDYEDKIK